MFSRKRKKKQYKYINGAKGAISILLCILMTPFTMITLGLVEFHRYQSVIEITKEIMELTGISAMSDYDPYLHQRFGVLATSQEIDSASLNGYAGTAAGSFGKQITIDGVQVSGSAPLSDNEVLKQQIKDFSELTAPMAVVMEDLKLQELIDALNGMGKFQQVMNMATQFANLADKLKEAVDAGKDLIKSLGTLKTNIDNLITSGNNLKESAYTLIQKLSEDGLYIPAGASEETVEGILESLVNSYETYKQLILDVLDDAKQLKRHAGTIESNVNQVSSDLTTFVDKVNAAIETLDNTSDGKGAGGSENAQSAAAEPAKGALEAVLEEVTKAAEKAKETFTETAKSEIKKAANKIKDESLKSLGISGMLDRYRSIASGTYFSWPLSDQAEKDLTTLLKVVPSVWNTGSADQLTKTLKSLFVPKINVDVRELKNIVTDAMDEALKALEECALKELAGLLTKLVNAVRGLFNLNVFYDPSLNAAVSIASGGSNPYQAFLEAVGSALSAAAGFGDSIKNWNIFGLIDACQKLIRAAADAMVAVFNIVGSKISGMVGLVKDTFSGKLYDRLAIAGYMRHNLPCRTSTGSFGYTGGGGQITKTVHLKGGGLTGMSFDDIARPETVVGKTVSLGAGGKGSVFENLSNFINTIKNAAGGDKMFKGAELEYVKVGTNFEVMNQIVVFFDLYFIRFVLNVPTVLMDAEVTGLAAAATIASWLVYLIYMLVEPFMDTILLVNGGEVSIVKSKCYMTAGGVGTFLGELADVTIENEQFRSEVESAIGDATSITDGKSAATDGGGGIGAKVGYETLVMLTLLTEDPDDMIDRLGDLMTLEGRCHYGDSFSLDNAYTVLHVSGNVEFDFFLDTFSDQAVKIGVDVGY